MRRIAIRDRGPAIDAGDPRFKIERGAVGDYAVAIIFIRADHEDGRDARRTRGRLDHFNDADFLGKINRIGGAIPPRVGPSDRGTRRDAQLSSCFGYGVERVWGGGIE